ncbi:MAG: TPMT family class I SAM-dependent methyltransferase [Bacteroidales bacterium]|nr:TPMT family class I SAM-dependent methyltransferase [Bacteroidales bacterium]
MNKNFDSNYWENRWKENKIGWDSGAVSTPIKEYIDQLKDKTIKILIPGAGNGYEVEYLYSKGFKDTFYMDFAQSSIRSFLNRFSDFPNDQIITENFFEHQGKYDLIIELAFFTSFPPEKRIEYVHKLYCLLNKGGKMAGLFFNHEFGNDYPPFGGTQKEYRQLFSSKFKIRYMETAYNSIKPRAGRELFILLQKI